MLAPLPLIPPRPPRVCSQMTAEELSDYALTQRRHAKAMIAFLDWFLLVPTVLMLAWAWASGASHHGTLRWLSVGMGVGGAMLLQAVYRSQRRMAWRILDLDEVRR